MLGTRHPWETARAEAIGKLIGRLALPAARVLDVGCGDSFLLGELRRSMDFSEAVAQDIHLSPELAERLRVPGIELVQHLSELDERRFDLILLLDVLEHLENPAELLGELRERYLASNGRLLITVPAFQSLFTEHDRQLKHFRRYSRRQISALARESGLLVRDSGYLFLSLLLPRALSALKERLRPTPSLPQVRGVGDWRAPGYVTQAIHRLLCTDNALCLRAQAHGVTLPGLSAWITCSAR